MEYTSIENKSNIYSWDRCAACLKILQEMLKLRTLYEKIEEKLNPSVRYFCYKPMHLCVYVYIFMFVFFSDSSIYV